MPRPQLLIVDSESLRTPGLVSAMEGDGWQVRWVSAAEAVGQQDLGPVPDLLLLDSTHPDPSGYDLARRLRALKPELPVLVFTDGTTSGGVHRAGVGVQGFLERSQPDLELAAALRRFRPGGQKLTSEDLFGDLLEDLEVPVVPASSPAPVAPPPVDPFAMFEEAPRPAPKPSPAPAAPAVPVRPVTPIRVVAKVPAPEPPVAPAPRGLLTTEDLFGDVLQEVEALQPVRPKAPPAPEPKAAPAPPPPPAAPPAAAVSPVSVAPAQAPAAEALAPQEFTLSGISGVHDPFERPAEVAGEAVAAPLAPAAVEPLPGAQVLEEYGNYYLIEKIAVGGMAELFKAQQRGVQGFQKIVAIKRILPHFSDNEDFVTMFIDEAKLAAQLTHPNIAQIFDLGKAGNSYYIAMEYVNGRDLRTLLKRVREWDTPFPEQVAAFVVMKVAAALDYAHRKRGFDDRELKLVHRDISPQNILISTEGAVKLVDFGIAKAASKASHTVAGALKGKLLYMSPEQATGQPLDNRSDLYSLGLVLFELLTGERCFQADSELGVLEKVRLGRVSDLQALKPGVSRDMAAIVNRALQKHVDQRYPSARFMERDLREYLQRQGSPVTEHDVAEYMDALLVGPKDRLEALLDTRFPQAVSTSAPAAPQRAATPKTAGDTATRVRARTLPGLPPSVFEDPEFQATRTRPAWLLPAILVLAALLVALLWLVSRG